jgi:hypothetical protein
MPSSDSLSQADSEPGEERVNWWGNDVIWNHLLRMKKKADDKRKVKKTALTKS